MARVVVTEFVSLDGVMEGPGGDDNETRKSSALLLGRRTYEGFAAAWPSRDGEFADKFNQHAEVRRVLDARGPRLE